MRLPWGAQSRVASDPGPRESGDNRPAPIYTHVDEVAKRDAITRLNTAVIQSVRLRFAW